MATDADVGGWRRPHEPRVGPGLAVLATAAVLAVGGDLAGVLADESSEVLVAGAAGPLVAVLVVLVWLAAGMPYAVVVGQVGLVVGLDGGPTATPVAQAMLVGLLILDIAAGRRRSDQVRILLVATVVALGLFAILTSEGGTLATAGAILGVTALVGYTIHRYERLSLGLVGDAE